jgi:hypothetical protein
LGSPILPRGLFGFEKRIHIERFPSFEHEVDGPAEFMGQDGQGFCLSVFIDQTVMIVLSELIISEKQACCF